MPPNDSIGADFTTIIFWSEYHKARSFCGNQVICMHSVGQCLCRMLAGLPKPLMSKVWAAFLYHCQHWGNEETRVYLTEYVYGCIMLCLVWLYQLFLWIHVIHLALSLQWRHKGGDSVSNHQPHNCLLNRLFRRRSKKTSKLRVTGLCGASTTENASIRWCHHVIQVCFMSTETIIWFFRWQVSQSARFYKFDESKLRRNVKCDKIQKGFIMIFVPHHQPNWVKHNSWSAEWVKWNLKSTIIWPFVQKLLNAKSTENIRAQRYWFFVRGIPQSLMDSPHKRPLMPSVSMT